jgi:hypothetical protein
MKKRLPLIIELMAISTFVSLAAEMKADDLAVRFYVQGR